jgi:hypothetical protein
MGCARTGTRWRWPNRVIPFTVNNEDFPANTNDGQAARQAIQNAITAWNSQKVITIRPRAGEQTWVEFVATDEPDGACSSHVGKRSSGRQYIYCNPTFDPNCQTSSNRLIHEIGHAIGLWHEHQRGDRNNFVIVRMENVRSDKRHNFERHVDDGTDIGPYNYGSIMHYRPDTFAVDWAVGTPVVGHLSRTAPALAAAGRELHMVHLGEESNQIWHSWTTDGDHWTEDREVGDQRSQTPPAIVEWQGALHMVHTGNSSTRIWHSRSVDRRTWEEMPIENQQSKAGPSLAVFGSELHMVHLGETSNIIYHSWTADGQNWVQRPIDGQLSKGSPALAAFNGQLHMVHQGDTSNNLWHSWSDDGRTWTDNERIPDQKSQAPVALAEFGGRLHIAHIGDESPTMWHSRYDGTAWSTNNRRDNAESRRSPTLAVFAGKLHMSHIGRTSNVIYHTVRDTTLEAIDSPEALGSCTISSGDILAIEKMYQSI